MPVLAREGALLLLLLLLWLLLWLLLQVLRLLLPGVCARELGASTRRRSYSLLCLC